MVSWFKQEFGQHEQHIAEEHRRMYRSLKPLYEHIRAITGYPGQVDR